MADTPSARLQIIRMVKMWFVDIVIDIYWLSDQNGDLGLPRSRSKYIDSIDSIEYNILLYGTDYDLKYIRILMKIDSEHDASIFIEKNILHWINKIDALYNFVSEKPLSSEASIISDNFMTIYGKFEEESQTLVSSPIISKPVKLNYDAFSLILSEFQTGSEIHMFYLKRFLNCSLPLDVRWLNGYRFMEWHFCRGKVNLSKNENYRSFLNDNGSDLDVFLKNGQDRKGLIEEIRAIAAHAILEKASPENANGKINSMIIETLPILWRLVIFLLNKLSKGNIILN